VRACGGAYGNPLEREPTDVLDDVLDEYIDRDKAMADYGVVINEGFEINVEATRRQRQAMSRS
jgi:N-methylhydantoinase B